MHHIETSTDIKVTLSTVRTGHDSAEIRIERLIGTTPDGVQMTGPTVTIKFPILETSEPVDDPDDPSSMDFGIEIPAGLRDTIGLPVMIQVNGRGDDVEREIERDDSMDYDDDDDGPQRFRDDDAIVMLAHIIRTTDDDITVTMTGSGGYWSVHDVVHALCHVQTEDRYDGEDRYRLEVSADDETEALVKGGLLAIAIGVSPSDVVRAVAAIEPRFRERFRHGSDAVEGLLSRLTVTAPDIGTVLAD